MWEKKIHEAHPGFFLLCFVPLFAAAVEKELKQSPHFILLSPDAIPVQDQNRLIDMLEIEYAALFPLPAPIKVVLHADYDSFRTGSRGTGHNAAKWHKGRLHLGPLHKLDERKILRSTVKHELTHLWVNERSSGKAPQWLAEGICVWKAGEVQMARQGSSATLIVSENKKPITYGQAGAFIEKMAAQHGPEKIEMLLRRLASGEDVEAVFKGELGVAPGEIPF